MQTTKIQFWDTTRKGANWFNEVPTKAWLAAAKTAGVSVVRLAPNRWKSTGRDFLIGNADRYTGLVEQDTATLIEVLDWAHSLNLKMVLTTLSLPGARWRQQNGDAWDFRLWRDPAYLTQAAQFWQDVAKHLAGHSALAGYDLLNEPQPERAMGLTDPEKQDIRAWYATVENTPADLNRFYTTLLQAVRSVDKETPVIFGCDTVYVLPYLRPVPDNKVLYSFHFYEPYHFTNLKINANQIRYPGPTVLEQLLHPAIAWQKEHRIASRRIFVGEFGCQREVRGAEPYLSDALSIFNRENWHRAFYAFREDKWDGMDYELGTQKLPVSYWWAKEQGKNPPLPRANNALWNVLHQDLLRQASTT